MAQKVNSAYRINKVLNPQAYKDSKPVIDAWAETFEIKESTPSVRCAIVSKKLSALYDEVQIISEQLKSTDYSEQLYLPHISRIQDAISPMLFNTTWNAVKSYLPADTMYAISFWSETLPNEELTISEEDLNEISEKVDELEGMLETSTLSPRLQSLIRQHINNIREALNEYEIRGFKSLKSTLHEAYGDLAELSEEIKNETNEDNVKVLMKVKTTWEKIQDVVSSAETIDKLYSIGHKGVELIADIFNIVS
jgi:hypothetical protein